MRYFEIGQRIRRYRKACGLSQEALAGRGGISVLAKIAEELSVSTDALLNNTPKPDKAGLSAEAQEILDSFETDELPVALEVLRALRDGLAKRRV